MSFAPPLCRLAPRSTLSTEEHFCNARVPIPHTPPRERSLARTMPLIYAFVARRTTVLAEYTNYSGNFSTIATQVGPRARRARWETRESARGGPSVPAVGSSGFGRSRARVRMETRDPRDDDDERARVRSRDDDDDDDD